MLHLRLQEVNMAVQLFPIEHFTINIEMCEYIQ